MHKIWLILKNSKDIESFIIKGQIYRIEKHKLYKYINYKWKVYPLPRIERNKLDLFLTDLKQVLGIIDK